MVNLYPWLQSYYDKITTAFSEGYGHHAILFRAEQGLGVQQLVQAVASRIICQSEDSQNKPCDHCHSCHLFQASNHPDVYSLAPIEDKDIGVDQIREINQKVAQHAQQGGNKIVCIEEVNRLTESASNALLKTLEEPRPNTYFLLNADLSASLMATIYSRCQVWIIDTPVEQVAINWLQQQCTAEISDIDTALRMSYGRPLLALTYLTQGLLEKRREFLRAFWLFYIRRSPLELLPLFDKTLTLSQLDWLLAFLSDAIKFKLNIYEGWINQDLAKGVQQFSEQQQVVGLLKAIQIIQKVRWDLMKINGVNQELILLDGLSRLITEVFDPKI
ncbi:DNA polymerase III subunit delta' [Pasteurella bettyae]|uniref:DNA polymerase III subunit delta' n=1 Tax=Pasteurella bettyae TaxID=752 RepID=UPI003D2B47D8